MKEGGKNKKNKKNLNKAPIDFFMNQEEESLNSSANLEDEWPDMMYEFDSFSI